MCVKGALNCPGGTPPRPILATNASSLTIALQCFPASRRNATEITRVVTVINVVRTRNVFSSLVKADLLENACRNKDTPAIPYTSSTTSSSLIMMRNNVILYFTVTSGHYFPPRIHR